MAKASIKVTRTVSRTKVSSSKSKSKNKKGRNRCSACGRYL